jgi:hypothetical protein
MSEYLDSNIEVESNSYIFGGKDNKNKKDINKNKKDTNKNKKDINKNKKDNNKNLIEYDKKNKFYLIRENKKIEELSNEWCYQKYQELWNFNPMNNIKNLPINIEHSSIIRMFNLNILKYINLYNSMDTIVIVFKLYDGNINKETNYAILFAYLYESAVIKIESKKRVNFSFYSCGPSYISCDGEYRSKFNWLNNVEISKTILFRRAAISKIDIRVLGAPENLSIDQFRLYKSLLFKIKYYVMGEISIEDFEKTITTEEANILKAKFGSIKDFDKLIFEMILVKADGQDQRLR